MPRECLKGMPRDRHRRLGWRSHGGMAMLPRGRLEGSSKGSGRKAEIN
jgi:hypothetical protein